MLSLRGVKADDAGSKGASGGSLALEFAQGTIRLDPAITNTIPTRTRRQNMAGTPVLERPACAGGSNAARPNIIGGWVRQCNACA